MSSQNKVDPCLSGSGCAKNNNIIMIHSLLVVNLEHIKVTVRGCAILSGWLRSRLVLVSRGVVLSC